MKINNLLLSFFAMLFLPIMSQAQDPLLNSWIMSTGTASYDYYPGPPTSTTNVNLTDSADVMQVCTTSTHVYVRANGLASYTMGPWLMNPNVPAAQNNTYKFPLSPQQETGTKTATPWGGPQGLAVNGVNMYGYGDARSYKASTGTNEGNGDGNWNSDAWVSEGQTMDPSGNGHADGQGNYHYHANPSTLYSDPSSMHSPIIGYAFDGYPIYGPFGYSSPMDSLSTITRMAPSYQLRTMSDRTVLPNGQTSNPAGPAINTSFPLGTYVEDYEYVASSGDLDEFNGRMCRTPEYPDGTYAYFLSTESNGDPKFPYIMASEYYGVVASNDVGPQAGNQTVPAGAVCGTFTGIEELQQTPKALTLYPNPTENMITMEVNTIGFYSVQLFDVLGCLVYSETKNIDGQSDLSLKTMNIGVYIVLVTNTETGEAFTSKVVKK